MDHVARNEMTVMVDHLQRQREFARILDDIFRGIDRDEDGLVHLWELQQLRQTPEMHRFASCLGMEEEHLEVCFEFLTHHGREPVSVEQFVAGCIKMKGYAKSVDVFIMTAQQQQLKMALKKLHADLKCAGLQGQHDIFPSDSPVRSITRNPSVITGMSNSVIASQSDMGGTSATSVLEL